MQKAVIFLTNDTSEGFPSFAMANRFYQFGDFRLDAEGRVLLLGSERVPLTPKAVETLLLLVENHGNVVDKDELMKRVWPDTFVEEISLTRNISVLRKTLNDGSEVREFIETIPKRGYRFVADVTIQEATLGFHAASRPHAILWKLFSAKRSPRLASVGAILAAVLVVGAFLGWYYGSRPAVSSASIMLAVLPVENLSGDEDREYICDGITEELITELGRLNPHQLGVIARTSAMTYKKTPKAVPQIGRELAVDFLVEGSARLSGDRLRVTAQLIRVRDQTHLWAQSYDRNVTDIVALEIEVAHAIAREIEVRLAREAAPGLASARAVNPAAHLAYLEGRYYWNRRSRDALQRSIVHLQQAIALDPDFARAYSALADSYMSLGLLGTGPSNELFAQAKAAVLTALSLDDNLAEAHTSLAYLKFWQEWDWLGAESEFKKAITLNPDYATAHQWYAEYLRLMGRFDESIREGTRALELDPLSLVINMEAGLPYYLQHQYDKAIEHFQKAIDLDPNFALAYVDLGWAYEGTGELKKAIATLEKAVQLDDTTAVLASLGQAYAIAGRTGHAKRILKDLERRSRVSYVSSFLLAGVYRGLGDDNRTLDLLERAYQEHDWGLIWLNVGSKFESLRSNPRFAALLRSMNFPARGG